MRTNVDDDNGKAETRESFSNRHGLTAGVVFLPPFFQCQQNKWVGLGIPGIPVLIASCPVIGTRYSGRRSRGEAPPSVQGSVHSCWCSAFMSEQ
ncbi:hypothetical protein DUNSADRAFT_13790 [Dunaliella salina]|uniref:Encoded protein n=1 Tax=Dunaliella salina TaxID=3046 RepID=A0ABQ7G8P1_DUNSA|nr:hypothetical protein DUNSADRAFT_13790 [Dunaliella salina]|eukprot:KAF5830980.1 hypothetical protein DUNSADRAFT_13790 [Dunaliella salina]